MSTFPTPPSPIGSIASSTISPLQFALFRFPGLHATREQLLAGTTTWAESGLPLSALVSTECRGRVFVVSLRREQAQCRQPGVGRELDVALKTLDDDPDVWVGVLTGTSSVFSAGSDLTSQGDYVTERGGEYGVIRRKRRKPLIAAVEGFASAVGSRSSSRATSSLPPVTAASVCPRWLGASSRHAAGCSCGPRRPLPLNLARDDPDRAAGRSRTATRCWRRQRARRARRRARRRDRTRGANLRQRTPVGRRACGR